MKQPNFSIRYFYIGYGMLWLFWVMVQVAIEWFYGAQLGVAVAVSVVSNFILALLCKSVGNIFNYYLPSRNNALYLILWCVIVVFVWYILVVNVVPFFMANYSEYIAFFNYTLPLRLAVAFLLIGITVLFMWIWQSLKNRNENNQKLVEITALAKQTELNNLRQQLQPHFLFNSLNSISALAGTQPPKARLMIQQLSDFLRGTIQQDENKLIALKNDIEHLSLYLEIEKVRFGYRLNTQIEIDEIALKAKIPVLFLQPIVENAIKFGLYDTLDNVTITLHATMKENILHIAIANPYEANAVNAQKGTGFGLSALQRRLYLLYNRTDLLTTTAQNGIFTTYLNIPQNLNQA